jgi:ABC-type uncharacterized transport system involved in gliding motility auxiliary subunit
MTTPGDAPLLPGVHERLALVRAEQSLLAAIIEVTQERPQRAYFFAGCGEHEITDFREYTGYAAIARALRRDAILTQELRLDGTARVPDDCDVLIIPGPDRRLGTPALAAIEDYLGRNGRLLVLLDAMTRTGLETLFETHGVVFNDDRIVTPPTMAPALMTLMAIQKDAGSILEVTSYGHHPITRQMEGVVTMFYRPRSLTLTAVATNTLSTGNRYQATILATSRAGSWGETDLRQQPPRFDPARDRSGPLPVGVAIERGPPPGINAEIKPMRIVAIGDSGFAANGCLSGGNQELFLGAVHWLLRQEPMIGASPRQAPFMRLTLDSRRQMAALLAIVGAIPGFVLVIGGFMTLFRRMRS